MGMSGDNYTYTLHWLSIIFYATPAHGIIVKYRGDDHKWCWWCYMVVIMITEWYIIIYTGDDREGWWCYSIVMIMITEWYNCVFVFCQPLVQYHRVGRKTELHETGYGSNSRIQEKGNTTRNKNSNLLLIIYVPSWLPVRYICYAHQ